MTGVTPIWKLALAGLIAVLAAGGLLADHNAEQETQRQVEAPAPRTPGWDASSYTNN